MLTNCSQVSISTTIPNITQTPAPQFSCSQVVAPDGANSSAFSGRLFKTDNELVALLRAFSEANGFMDAGTTINGSDICSISDTDSNWGNHAFSHTVEDLKTTADAARQDPSMDPTQGSSNLNTDIMSDQSNQAMVATCAEGVWTDTTNEELVMDLGLAIDQCFAEMEKLSTVGGAFISTIAMSSLPSNMLPPKDHPSNQVAMAQDMNLVEGYPQYVGSLTPLVTTPPFAHLPAQARTGYISTVMSSPRKSTLPSAASTVARVPDGQYPLMDELSAALTSDHGSGYKGNRVGRTASGEYGGDKADTSMSTSAKAEYDDPASGSCDYAPKCRLSIQEVPSFEIRHQINELYGFPQLLPSITSKSFNYPSNIQELVDILIRRFLPQFWKARMQDPHLTQNHYRPSVNSRPHARAIFTTCVECGYKFHKQLIYDGPAAERQNERQARARARAEAAKFKKLQDKGGDSDGDEDEEEGEQRKRHRRAPGISHEDRVVPTSHISPINSLSFLSAETFSTETVDTEVLNKNRSRPDYDGNLDHVGIKENDHLNQECPLNRTGLVSNTNIVVVQGVGRRGRPARAVTSTIETQSTKRFKSTKLHVGWDVVPAHDFSDLIDPLAGYQYGTSTPSVGHGGSDQARQTPPYHYYCPQHDYSRLAAPFTAYYPARSLMASFTHLLPCGVQLTTILIRKLFAYFVWHPWLDSDLQAITLRVSYQELWALFLVSGGGPEPDQENESKRSRIQKIKRERDRKEVAMEMDDAEEAGEVGREWEEHTEGLDEDKYGANTNTASNPFKKQKRSSRDHSYIRVESLHHPGHNTNISPYDLSGLSGRDQSSASVQLHADISEKVDSHRSNSHTRDFSVAVEERELLRLRSMEQRFMTYFEASLRIHNVFIHRRPLTRREVARQEQNILLGWALGAELSVNNARSMGGKAITSRRMGLYAVVDPSLLDSSKSSKVGNREDGSESGNVLTPAQVLAEQTRLVELPELLSSPLLAHDQLTQATANPRGAMARTEKVIQCWAHRAEERRQQLGFRMPPHKADGTPQPGLSLQDIEHLSLKSKKRPPTSLPPPSTTPLESLQAGAKERPRAQKVTTTIASPPVAGNTNVDGEDDWKEWLCPEFPQTINLDVSSAT